MSQHIAVFVILAFSATTAFSSSANAQCPALSTTSDDLVLELATTNCFTMPGSADIHYQATILNSVYGRHEISEGNSGYAWGDNADGIYYCVDGGTTISFSEYPTNSVVTISAIEMSADQCNSDVVSYGGVVPATPPTSSSGTDVYFSSHRYYLKAMHFEYTVAGEDTVTFEDAQSVQMSGDPGNDEYHSIEVNWRSADDKDKRLFAYVYADGSSWEIREVRVYNNQQEWVYFYPNDYLKGNLGGCFKRESLIINNGNGSEIKFTGLSLATFTPWANETDFLQCIDGTLLRINGTRDETEPIELKSSLSDSLNVNEFQVELLAADMSTTARVAGRDRAQSSCIANSVLSGELAAQLNSKLHRRPSETGVSVELIEATGSADDAMECYKAPVDSSATTNRRLQLLSLLFSAVTAAVLGFGFRV